MQAPPEDQGLNAQHMPADIAVAIAPEVVPTGEKKKKTRSAPGTKRPPARPYKKISKDVLETRIAKLTARVQKTKRQHESAQTLLTKYAQESFYREKDVLQAEPAPEASAS